MIKYLIGLGNPDMKYQGNRHNIGFMFIDALAHKYNVKLTAKFHGEFSFIEIKQKVILFKPATYMNNSGIPIAEMLKFFKGNMNEVLIIHDDLDLSLTKLKMKRGGSNGGHNGLTSISTHLGNEYNRLRIGIGRPERTQSVADYVLSDFNQGEKVQIKAVLEFLINNIGSIINNHQEMIMNTWAIYSRNLREKESLK